MIDFPNDSKKWDVVEQPSPKKQMTVARKKSGLYKDIERSEENTFSNKPTGPGNAITKKMVEDFANKDNKTKATGEKD